MSRFPFPTGQSMLRSRRRQPSAPYLQPPAQPQQQSAAQPETPPMPFTPPRSGPWRPQRDFAGTPEYDDYQRNLSIGRAQKAQTIVSQAGALPPPSSPLVSAQRRAMIDRNQLRVDAEASRFLPPPPPPITESASKRSSAGGGADSAGGSADPSLKDKAAAFRSLYGDGEGFGVPMGQALQLSGLSASGMPGQGMGDFRQLEGAGAAPPTTQPAAGAGQTSATPPMPFTPNPQGIQMSEQIARAMLEAARGDVQQWSQTLAKYGVEAQPLLQKWQQDGTLGQYRFPDPNAQGGASSVNLPGIPASSDVHQPFAQNQTLGAGVHVGAGQYQFPTKRGSAIAQMGPNGRQVGRAIPAPAMQGPGMTVPVSPPPRPETYPQPGFTPLQQLPGNAADMSRFSPIVGAAAAGAGASGAATGAGQSGGAPVRITSDAEWEALPPGTTFVGPDGVPRRK